MINLNKTKSYFYSLCALSCLFCPEIKIVEYDLGGNEKSTILHIPLEIFDQLSKENNGTILDERLNMLLDGVFGGSSQTQKYVQNNFLDQSPPILEVTTIVGPTILDYTINQQKNKIVITTPDGLEFAVHGTLDTKQALPCKLKALEASDALEIADNLFNFEFKIDGVRFTVFDTLKKNSYNPCELIQTAHELISIISAADLSNISIVEYDKKTPVDLDEDMERLLRCAHFIMHGPFMECMRELSGDDLEFDVFMCIEYSDQQVLDYLKKKSTDSPYDRGRYIQTKVQHKQDGFISNKPELQVHCYPARLDKKDFSHFPSEIQPDISYTGVAKILRGGRFDLKYYLFPQGLVVSDPTN